MESLLPLRSLLPVPLAPPPAFGSPVPVRVKSLMLCAWASASAASERPLVFISSAASESDSSLGKGAPCRGHKLSSANTKQRKDMLDSALRR